MKNTSKNNNTPKEHADSAAPNQAEYATRVCVPVPMPIQCPNCHSSKTTIGNGIYYNKHTSMRYENRTCRSCGYTFTSYRRMTEDELKNK